MKQNRNNLAFGLLAMAATLDQPHYLNENIPSPLLHGSSVKSKRRKANSKNRATVCNRKRNKAARKARRINRK